MSVVHAPCRSDSMDRRPGVDIGMRLQSYKWTSRCGAVVRHGSHAGAPTVRMGWGDDVTCKRCLVSRAARCKAGLASDTTKRAGDSCAHHEEL